MLNLRLGSYRSRALRLVSPFLAALLAPSSALGSFPCPTCNTWKPLRIGAGGWVTGIDIASDGTKVIRTDQYGAYVWNTSTSQWDQLVTSSSMPSEDVSVDPKKGLGIYEIRIAPSNVNRFYMTYRGFVYRSDDRGAHWSRTAFSQVSLEANDSYRMDGPKMAVDPADADVVYVGTPQNGVWVTADAGSSWARVSAIPTSTSEGGEYPGYTGMQFDPTSGTTGGKTNTVYIGSWGNGVWKSTNAGSTWSQMAGGGKGGPTKVERAAVAADGNYYCTDYTTGYIWRYADNTWTDITDKKYDRSYHTITPDPRDPSRLVAGEGSGSMLAQSHDRGATWYAPYWDTLTSRVATDIPWLAWTNEDYMSSGDMQFDPVSGDLYFAEGIGVWRTTFPQTRTSLVWSSQSKGIEQLVANSIAAPPGGRPVVASWDRPLFYVDNPDVFPSQHGPNNANAIVMGWSVDYASTNPSFLAAVADWWGVEQSCYSTNGGQTWTVFPTMPAWWPGSPGMGTLAVSTPDNIVWVASNGEAPYYTKDGGQTWQKISLPGVPDTPDGWSGLHWAYFLNRHIVTADRVNAGTFYAYHTSKGLYRSTDGGSTWTLVRSGEIAPFSGNNAKLKSVPGRAGHLFFTSGQQDGDPNPSPSGYFMRSTDSGATWTAVPNVLEVYAFGFGKEAQAAGGYPAIYIAGWVSGVYGIWRSDDEGGSWSQIGDFPLGSLDEIKAVEGDKNTYGLVYLGFSGFGYAYGGIGGDGDLSLTGSGNPNPVAHGGQLTYTLTVRNEGSTSISGVTLSDALPNGADYVGSGSTVGSCAPSAGAVSCDLGELAGGMMVSVTITVSANTVGMLVNQASVTGSASDPNTLNNTVSIATTVLPVISIDDVSVPEGNAGIVAARFTVSLSALSSSTVTVAYTTADDTATAASDYVASNGTVSFPPGSTRQTLLVGIRGDRIFESDETFLVNLTSPVGAMLGHAQAVGTILNDDAPGFSIDDVSVSERESGPATAVFTVTLSPTETATVTVDYQTMNDTALAGSDYQAAAGTLTFPPFTSAQPINITINPDSLVEGIETFFVNLTGSSGAPIAYNQGVGRILDSGFFFTLTPCRVLDTRDPPGPYGGPALAAGKSRTFALFSRCGIPASASVVSVNVTVTQPSVRGHLRLYRAGTTLPLTSSLNYAAGQTRANNAIVRLSAAGELAIYCGQPTGSTHVIVDVNGYFE